MRVHINGLLSDFFDLGQLSAEKEKDPGSQGLERNKKGYLLTLFHRNALGQIPGFVYIGAFQAGGVVGQ